MSAGYRTLVNLTKRLRRGQSKSKDEEKDEAGETHAQAETRRMITLRYGKQSIGKVLLTLPEDLRDKVEDSLLEEDKLELGNLLLTAGEFGALYSGWFMEGTERSIKVLVKTFKVGSTVPDTVKNEFLRHVTSMVEFNHKNVALLEGVMVKDQIPLAAYPWSLGNLKEYINQRVKANDPLTEEQCMFWIYDAAEGMHYLSLRGFIHGDVAARNCFVTAEQRLKICDAGLSRDLYPDDYVTSAKDDRILPVRWTAPEILKGGELSLEGDVFSFGVLCWEIMSKGGRPHGDMTDDQVQEFVVSGKKLPKLQGSNDSVYSMMVRCWDKYKDQRPEYNAMSEFLSQLINGDAPTEVSS